MKKNSRLPNMRNLGIVLRIIIIANTGLIAGAAILSQNWAEFISQLTTTSTFAQPVLLICLFLLYGCYPYLLKLNYLKAIIAVFAIVSLSAAGMHSFLAQFWIFTDLPSLLRILGYAFTISGIILYYLDLYRRAYSPAITEARLQALQARIRPHFLFNSLNAVLSLIRSQPKQAETALEDMADLFRVLMADNRDLVPLAQEIALCRQYLSLEKLRLDERLKVEWLIDDMPPDALVPPLLLQPLIENAVYHGIEPMPEGGTITIQIYTQQHEIHLVVKNPYFAQNSHQHGNKMALNNIKERLTLHFDLEASLHSKKAHGLYMVHITIPQHSH
ncbi:MAG: sensor histidine kinase [Betaproteobacteria bacterium HGW-Betaproteobacteria-22]|nr:MAG: sensor histidine kinase [Betaproteobacteria bacterium HGW-Betaproteobacteria-22]